MDNGASWIVITSSTSNNGSYSWTLPNANSTTCLVKVSNTANLALNDVSDNVFTIRPAVQVFTPNGFDELGACTQTSISFNHTPAYTNYTIEYSINNGGSWTTLVSNQAFSGTTGTYSWSVPNLPTNQARVRVYPTSYSNLADASDTTFTIKRAVTIIQPNFGGVLQQGTTYPIIWSSDGISNIYDLAYSTNGGSTWTNIILGYNTSTNTYNWTVPNISSTNCLIRIRDNINSCKEDISDLPFTISSTAAPITVTAPNGQDTLQGCQSYVIRWTESGAPLGNYNIDYSVNAGQTWLPVVSNYATTSGTYNWVVPNINTTTVLIRVASSANNTIFDLSNAAFNIFGRSVVASADTTVCSGNIVQLQATGGNGTFTWTPSNTLSNANIANPLATPSTTTNYVVISANGTCTMRDTAVVTVLSGTATNVGVNVTASPSAAVCAGGSILFTAIPTNGGTNPAYQWKKNNSNVGNNSANYILNPVTNNDVITCVLTSNAACATNNPATSNAVTVTVFNSSAPTITISTPNASVCAGQSVTFTAATTNAGNAPIYQWMVNNINSGTNSATFTTSTLNNNDVVTCTLTSNAACVTNATANSNALLMTVIPSTVPSVTISTATSTICNGSSASFTASATNGGASPVYQWKVNGNNVGSNSATFSSSTLNNGDVVTVALTSNATCPAPVTVTSNTIAMTVTGSVVPSVTINVSATSICAGASATFTAVPVNGGATPTYQWKVNGLNVGTGNTYTSSSLNNNDTVRVVMTSSSGCALPTTATSVGTVVTVNPNVAPTSTIAGSNNICAGTSVTYTATTTNAGTMPSYQWKLNGNNVGGNSSTYITSALANNDTLYCMVTSSSSCATPNTATSNKIGVTVSTNVTPAISIAATNTSVCGGTTVVFTATATNGGSTPAYQWKVNGNNVGSNSASYSSNTLNNSDVVTCVLTSNATCASPFTATSNAINMLVTPLGAPTIAISTATPTICSGANTTFTAIITNGGANAAYQWKVNNINAGTNSSTFSTSTLANNDVVTCQLTSSALCASPAVVTSNAIAVSVGPNVTPTVSISSNTTAVCAGTAVNFTATITGGGSTPAYQWKVNGGNVGTNSPLFSSTTLANNAVVTCVLTSSSVCATPASVTSNAVTITVNTIVAPTLSIAASSTTVCSGTAVTFTATATNAGTTPTYQWKLNGNNVGSNQATYSLGAPANNDVVSVVLTSSAACATPASITSNTVTLSVSQSITPSVAVTASSTNVCGGPITFTATAANEGTTPSYQWKVNGNNAGTNSATFNTGTLTNGDVVSVILTSSAACATTATANSNSITVTGSAATPIVSIAANNSNICQGTAVTFTATVTNPGTSQAYQWKVNGVNAGSNSNAFTVSTLTANDTVSCTVTVTSACAGTTVVSSNKLSIQILPSVNASVAIAASQNNICQGVAVTFTATTTNGGSTPAYQWKVNGVNTGTNNSQFISSTLSNNDTVTCVLTSSAICATPAAAISNVIVMLVQPSTAHSISISPSAVTTCQGSNVSFTATVVNAGANPTYQWKVNGNNVGSNIATFSTNSLANGDVVTCELTGSAVCSQPVTAASNAVTVNITVPVTPSVSITANTTSICNGNTITFTAASTHGGTAPVYTWMVNGNTVGGSSNTFSSTTLANGDVVTCQLTSNASCVTSTSALSNTITVNVTAPVTPTISIVASDTTICTGTAVTFTAIATNGGTTPSYLWMVNTSTVGTNSNVFTSSTLSNGDVVKCILTSSAACATTQVATSSNITIVVSISLQPTVAIAASADSACLGSAVTFTASTNNAGSNAQYNWLVNNNSTGITTATFTSSTLANDDVVVCRVTSSASCSNGAVVSSQPVTVHILSSIVPTVTVSANDTDICAGQNVVFAASATNGGTAPTYQWLLNGNNVGGNAATYASATLANSDVVTVRLTSSETCATVGTVSSAPLTIVVEASVVSSVSVSALPNDTICEGTNVTLTAQVVNGGNSAVYTWKVNGITEGANDATYISSNLSNGDVVVVEFVSSANCVAQAMVSSMPIAFTVNATPAAPVISKNGNVLTSSAPAGNQWHAAWQPISGATEQTYTINSNGLYSVIVTDANGCSSTSDSIQVQYTGLADIDWNSAISIAPNPFMEQFKVNLSAEVLANGDWTLTVTDMLGRVVYEKNILHPQMVIDFTHRAAGTYTVSISDAHTLHAYKVVKQ